MRRFLILEDEPFVAMDLQMAFEAAGHAAETAPDCDHAIELIEQQNFCGAILDVNLGGGETCEQAAAELNARSTPFILHTGDLNRAGELLRSFGVKIVEKPTEADKVIETLLSIIDKKIPKPCT
ncbi:response regulator [Sphingomicrobium marinum]|uniref:response regulator n=1 Tax=Sphingomicrobium marinum TaxID=1227950 RepID=UPI00223F47F5|nr:response regulator [Sphingomicrobium marinum]